MATLLNFLLERLTNAGVEYIFISEDDKIQEKLQTKSQRKIKCSSSLSAGYAADAFSRLKGFGCCVFSNDNGSNSSLVPFSCAVKENSPVLFVGINEKESDEQFDLFFKMSQNCIQLGDLDNAGYDIDSIFFKIKRNKKPAYLEIPKELLDSPIRYDPFTKGTPKLPKSDQEALQEALSEVKNLLESANDPMVLAGIEIARHTMGASFSEWAGKSGIPVVTTILAKGLIGENELFSAGVYSESLKKKMADSDCLLLLGTIPEEIEDMSFFKKKNTIISSGNDLIIKNHIFHNVFSSDFIKELISNPIKRKSVTFLECGNEYTNGILEKIDFLIDKKYIIISDSGSLDISLQLTSKGESQFICNSLYKSPCFSIGACIGVSTLLPEAKIIAVIEEKTLISSIQDIENMLKNNNKFVFVIRSNNKIKVKSVLDMMRLKFYENEDDIFKAFKTNESFVVILP